MPVAPVELSQQAKPAAEEPVPVPVPVPAAAKQPIGRAGKSPALTAAPTPAAAVALQPIHQLEQFSQVARHTQVNCSTARPLDRLPSDLLVCGFNSLF